jgi:hypothetical protein
MNRRHAAISLGCAAFALAWLAGCAGFGGPRNVILSQADLQTLIERQFPLQRRVLEVIDLNVARPKLRLLPDRNRVGTELDLSASERLGGHTARGSLSLDYALRYEASDASVRLADVRVQDARLDLGSGPLSPSTARVGALLAERLLEDFVLYRADAQRLQLIQRMGITAADIVVTSRGIEVRFDEPR